ncbi:MAG: imidazolonepropionase [Methanobacteriota archaeon]
MTTTECDLLVKNVGQLATLAGGLRKGRAMSGAEIIRNGAMAVADGKVLWVGKSSASSRFKAEDVLDAKGMAVVPGFVDAHTHMIFAGSRENELAMKLQGLSYMEIMKRGGGIYSTVRATRKASKSQLVEEGLARARRMLSLGTTTLEAKTGYCLDTKGEIKMLEAAEEVRKKTGLDIAHTFLGAHALSPDFKKFDDYAEHIVDEMLPAIAKRKLARYCDVFCEKGVFDVPQSREILMAARKLKLGLKLHADEVFPLRGGRLAAEMGAVSADHMLVTPAKDFGYIAKRGTIGVMLPGTPYVLMQDRYADARGMIDSGMAVALATDLNPNCWLESMQMVQSLACYRMRMTPAEALCASTVNAAHAIGMDSKVGSLEPGKQADFLVLDAPTVDAIPYRWGGNVVRDVWKRGKMVT